MLAINRLAIMKAKNFAAASIILNIDATPASIIDDVIEVEELIVADVEDADDSVDVPDVEVAFDAVAIVVVELPLDFGVATGAAIFVIV